MNSNSLSEPLTLWGLEDMIAVFPIEGCEIQQMEMLKRCVDVFFVSLNHEAVNVARTCRELSR